MCRRISEAVHINGPGLLGGLTLHCSLQLSKLCCVTMSASKLAAQEITLMDDMQKGGEEPKDISAKLQRSRARKGRHGPRHTAVYNFLAMATHNRDATENRGRISKMPPRLVSVVVGMHKRLIQQADMHCLSGWALRARGCHVIDVMHVSGDRNVRSMRRASSAHLKDHHRTTIRQM